MVWMVPNLLSCIELQNVQHSFGMPRGLFLRDSRGGEEFTPLRREPLVWMCHELLFV